MPQPSQAPQVGWPLKLVRAVVHRGKELGDELPALGTCPVSLADVRSGVHRSTVDPCMCYLGYGTSARQACGQSVCQGGQFILLRGFRGLRFRVEN